jgi:hypothetical protein
VKATETASKKQEIWWDIVPNNLHIDMVSAS